jgi:hypothetical protein
MKYRQAPDVLPLLRERLREVIPSLVYPAANQSAEARAFASLCFHKPSRNPRRISISWPLGLTTTFTTNQVLRPISAIPRGPEGDGEARRVFVPVARRAAETQRSAHPASCRRLGEGGDGHHELSLAVSSRSVLDAALHPFGRPRQREHRRRAPDVRPVPCHPSSSAQRCQ